MNVVPGSILQKFLPSAHSPIGVASQQQWALVYIVPYVPQQCTFASQTPRDKTCERNGNPTGPTRRR